MLTIKVPTEYFTGEMKSFRVLFEWPDGKSREFQTPGLVTKNGSLHVVPLTPSLAEAAKADVTIVIEKVDGQQPSNQFIGGHLVTS